MISQAETLLKARSITDLVPVLRLSAKRASQACALLLTLPFAVLCGFGRIDFLFCLFAHRLAFYPGVPGSFLRVGFYRWVLTRCSLDTHIGVGSFFSRRHVIIHPHVSIGSYCVIARAEIGPRTQIGSLVQITVPGAHARDSEGRLSDSLDTDNDTVRIGPDCWIGASSVVMADVGAQSTIGAGSVVVREIPSGVIAVGSPARPIKRSILSGGSESLQK